MKIVKQYVVINMMFSTVFIYLIVCLNTNIDNFYHPDVGGYWADRMMCVHKDMFGYDLPYGSQSCFPIIFIIVFNMIALGFFGLLLLMLWIIKFPFKKEKAQQTFQKVDEK